MPEPSAPVEFPFIRSPSTPDDPGGMALMRGSPVVRARLPHGTEIWVALSHAAVCQVFADPRFSRRAALEPSAPQVPPVSMPGMLISMDDPEHARTRRLMLKAFTPQMVEGLRPWLEMLVEDLLDDLARQPQPADLVEHLTMPLPVQVICQLLGVPYQDQDLFRSWIEALLNTSQVAMEQLRTYLARLVDLKREHPAADLISALAKLGELSHDQVIDNVLLLLVAGHETTQNQLSNSLIALLGERSQYVRLAEDPSLVPNATEELLRYLVLTPAGALVRIATEDIELGGSLIKAGEGVIPVQHTANRDPAVFRDPDRLDLARTDVAAHLAFAAGPHFCLGAQLARMELNVALERLVVRFPDLRLALPESQLSWKAGGIVRGPASLPVTW